MTYDQLQDQYDNLESPDYWETEKKSKNYGETIFQIRYNYCNKEQNCSEYNICKNNRDMCEALKNIVDNY